MFFFPERTSIQVGRTGYKGSLESVDVRPFIHYSQWYWDDPAVFTSVEVTVEFTRTSKPNVEDDFGELVQERGRTIILTMSIPDAWELASAILRGCTESVRRALEFIEEQIETSEELQGASGALKAQKESMENLLSQCDVDRRDKKKRCKRGN